MKRRIVLTVLGLAIVAALSAGALTFTARSTPHPRPAGPPSPAWLAALAGRIAMECQDAAPAAVVYCRTTESAAGPAVDATTQAVADPHRAVYLVVLRGRFVDPRAVVIDDPAEPRAHLAETCSYVAFSADARTHDVLDFGLTDTVVPAPTGAHWSRFAIPTSLAGPSDE